MGINFKAAYDLLKNTDLALMNNEIELKQLPAMTDQATAATLLVTGLRTQGDFAALIINLSEGRVTPGEITEGLKAAFPDNKVGDKHGAYYTSKARTGDLVGCRYAPPTLAELRRAKNPKSLVDISKLSAEQLEKALEWRRAQEAAEAEKNEAIVAEVQAEENAKQAAKDTKKAAAAK